MTSAGPPRLGLGRLAAYGAPGLPLAAMLLPLYVYLPTFYAAELGVGLAGVGAVLLAARLWDLVTDPAIGALSDRIGTRWGHRRPWMVAGLLPTVIAAWLLLVPGDGAGLGHLLLWAVLFHLGATMVQLPYAAWGAELSADYDERSRIAAAREVCVVLGTVLAAGLLQLAGDDGGLARPLAALALGLAVALPATVLVAVATVPEPGPARRAPPVRPGRVLRALAANGPFLRLIAAYLLNGIANGLPATLFLLFVGHVVAAPERAGLLLLVYFGCGVLAVPLWLRASRRWGKHRVWTAAMLWTCAAFSAALFLGPGNWHWFLLVCIATGATLGADLVLPSSMQADVIDLDRLRSGRERAGLYFGAWGMATKLALALAVGIAFPALALAGFDAGAAPQTPLALTALALLYAGLPIAFKLAAIALMARFPIGAAEQARIRRLIERRRRGFRRPARSVRLEKLQE